jgi:hypothetical protein
MAEVNIDVAKEESVQAVNTKVGTSSDTASSTPTTVFAGIKGLIAWFTGTWTAARAGYVDTINTNTALNNTASKTGTLSQKESYGISLLENATYGLSALKTAMIGGNIPIVKSVQSGMVTASVGTSTITISAINPAKSIVMLNNTLNSTTQSYLYVPYSLTSTTLTLKNAQNTTSSSEFKCSWQVVEFY